MKLSQGVEWTLHCVTLLALMPGGIPIRREQLAGHYGLPEAYLAKHLQAATKTGILRATPGPRGGYQLGRPAADITLLDVVEAIEGSARPFICQEIRRQGTGALPPENCERQCRINVAMNQADNAWRSSLRATTVADIADDLPDQIVERNKKLFAR